MMKLFVLSLALFMTAVAASAQSALPTPPATAPPSAAAGITVNTSTAAAPAPGLASQARQQIQAGAPPLSIDARIESRPVDSSVVGEVHCKPLYISTIHLPEAVTSIAVGAPTLFTAEHVENEP